MIKKGYSLVQEKLKEIRQFVSLAPFLIFRLLYERNLTFCAQAYISARVEICHVITIIFQPG